ncbi:MAG TPA: DOMON domain-containing protein [Spirochaetia bacterium]|nr:DOMON domain-containing protein [Spirochaetia bacterium]
MRAIANLFYVVLGALGYGHPFHPVLTHLVVGPVLVAFLLGLIAWIFRRPVLHQTARHLTVFSLVAWFFTVAVGILDWVHFYGADLGIFEIRMKLILASALLVVLIGTLVLHRRVPKESSAPVIAYAVSALLVVLLGYYGGNLVYASKTASSESTSSSAAQGQTLLKDGYTEKVVNGYTLDWKVDGKLLHVRMSHGSAGWLGVGFGHTGTMEGSDIKIGYLANGKPVIVDSFGDAPNHHSAITDLGGTSDVTDVSGSLQGSVTSFSFTVPLAPGDKWHAAFASGTSYDVIMAAGPDGAEDDSSYHGPGNYAVFKIVL